MIYSGIARRSRIGGLDGFTRRRSFHGFLSGAVSTSSTQRLVRCRSLPSACLSGRTSYAGAACVSAVRRGGEWGDDKFGGGADGSNSSSGEFLAGAMAAAYALMVTAGKHEDESGERDPTKSGDDNAGRRAGRSTVWCDGPALGRLTSGPFGDQLASRGAQTPKGGIFSSSCSRGGDSSDPRHVHGLSTLETAPLSITDVYYFEGEAEPIIGRGQRSVVSTARHRQTGQLVAVKRLARAETTRIEVMEEVNMLKVAGKHPNVVTMQAFFEDQEAYYIVMEMCEGGELYHRLADKGRYSEGQAARIMAEVASAVGFLHRNGIVHFDLKPENIMLALGGDDCVPEVRLADFGSAFRQYRQISSARDYTAAYSAPEVLGRHSVDDYRQVDMWALGVVMWVLLTGQHPFGANSELSEAEVARRVTEVEPDLKALRHVSPEGKDLVRRLLAHDPEDRPSALQLLSHPWLRAVVTTQRVSQRKNSLVRRRQQVHKRYAQEVDGTWGVRPLRNIGVTTSSTTQQQQQQQRQLPNGGQQRSAIAAVGRRDETATEAGAIGAGPVLADATAAAVVASVTGEDHLSA